MALSHFFPEVICMRHQCITVWTIETIGNWKTVLAIIILSVWYWDVFLYGFLRLYVTIKTRPPPLGFRLSNTVYLDLFVTYHWVISIQKFMKGFWWKSREGSLYSYVQSSSVQFCAVKICLAPITLSLLLLFSYRKAHNIWKSVQRNGNHQKTRQCPNW